MSRQVQRQVCRLMMALKKRREVGHLVVAGLLLGGVGWHWSRPQVGSPPTCYEVEVRDGWGSALPYGGEVPDTTYTMDPVNQLVRVRVRARDALGRVGPWSTWSESYLPPTFAQFWAGVAFRISRSPLTVVVGAMQEAGATWPDSLR